MQWLKNTENRSDLQKMATIFDIVTRLEVNRLPLESALEELGGN